MLFLFPSFYAWFLDSFPSKSDIASGASVLCPWCKFWIFISLFKVCSFNLSRSMLSSYRLGCLMTLFFDFGFGITATAKGGWCFPMLPELCLVPIFFGCKFNVLESVVFMSHFWSNLFADLCPFWFLAIWFCSSRFSLFSLWIWLCYVFIFSACVRLVISDFSSF